MSGPVLVVGFGDFPGVVNNPAGRLARAVGALPGVPSIRGAVIPVSFRRGLDETSALVAALRPLAILGVGVAVSRSEASLERWGRPPRPGMRDVDGEAAGSAPGDPRRSAWADELAPQLGVGLSEDAGDYVCNAWLFGTLGAWAELVPVGFLHIPAGGFPAEALAAGLRRWYGPRAPRSMT
jgi:pyrrolidone-carboxylate peptidase